MKIVDKLILRELVGPVVNSMFMFLMLLFAATGLLKVTDLIVHGAPGLIVAQITLFSLPALVTQTMPMAMLLGSLLAFGRLSGDSEHIALFASGTSFYRVVRPVIWMGVAVTLVAIAWDQTVVPPATRRAAELLQKAAPQMGKQQQSLTYNVMRDDGSVDEMVVIDGGLDLKTRMLRRVTIFKMSDDPKQRGVPVFVVYADRAYARDRKGLAWEYFDVDGWPLQRDPEGPAPKRRLSARFHLNQATTLPDKSVRIGRDFSEVMRSGSTDNHTMTFVQLRDKINRERERGSLNTLGDEVDLWGKISVPLASLIFGLVGAPLGIRPQRGSKAMGFGVAILIIFVYWMVYNWMYVVGKNGQIAPVVASFVADILGLVGAGILVARTRQ